MAVLPILVTALVGLVPSQQTPPPQPDCKAVEHRQFDFWLGDWNVTASGKPAGRNRIESRDQGCLLVEYWTGAGGGTGTSMNFYNRRTKQWQQVWIDNRGGVLELTGGMLDGKMVLESAALPQPAGGTVRHRVTWSCEPKGTVRQHWQSSTDGGKTWTTAFDGLYERTK